MSIKFNRRDCIDANPALEKLTKSGTSVAKFARKLGYSEKQYITLALQNLIKRDGLKFVVKLETA